MWQPRLPQAAQGYVQFLSVDPDFRDYYPPASITFNGDTILILCAECAQCGYPSAKLRSYEWGQKAKRRKTTGTGRMRYLKTVSRRFKNGFRCVHSSPCPSPASSFLPPGRTPVQSSGPRRRRRHKRATTPHDRLYRTSWWLLFVSHRIAPSVYVLSPVYCYTSTGTSCRHPHKIHELCHARLCMHFPGLPMGHRNRVLHQEDIQMQAQAFYSDEVLCLVC